MRIIETITAVVDAHPFVAYGLVLILALSESLPLLGAVIPGTAIIVGIAALVPSGVLKLYPMLAAATIGAIIGDGFAFWLGHHYHREIADRWPFKRYPALIAKSETFFDRHGGMSVFLARFTPGVRAFVPLVAGITQMPVVRFYTVNVFSALVWAPAHILPGVFAGVFAAAHGGVGIRLAVLILIVIAGVWLIFKLARYTMFRAVPVLFSMIDDLRDWCRQHDSYLSTLVLRLVGSAKNEVPILALLIATLIGATWLFLGIAEDVITGDPLVVFDQSVFAVLQELRTRTADTLMVAVTELGDTSVVLTMVGAVLALLVFHRSWRTALYFLAAVGGASLFNTAIKLAVHRSRPIPDLYTGWSDYSFPSGHSTENAALYGFLAFLVCRRLPSSRWTAVVLPMTSLIGAIAFSRVYLGAHWFSDVAAGLAFGTIWLIILMIAHLSHPSAGETTKGLLIVSVTALAVGGGVNVWHHHSADLERYAIRSDTRTMTESEWLDWGWKALPARRVDMTGEREEPFTIQYAGPISILAKQLEANGWKPSGGFDVSGLTGRLTQFSAVPLLNRGMMPSLIMVKEKADAPQIRYILRAWPADVALETTRPAPVWLVSAVEEQRKDVLMGIGIPKNDDAYDSAFQAVKRDLNLSKMTEKVRAKAVDWSGNLALVSCL
jgi:undecaprenyl-diphosphatase